MKINGALEHNVRLYIFNQWNVHLGFDLKYFGTNPGRIFVLHLRAKQGLLRAQSFQNFAGQNHGAIRLRAFDQDIGADNAPLRFVDVPSPVLPRRTRLKSVWRAGFCWCMIAWATTISS